MLDDGPKKRRHVLVVFVQLAQRETIFRAGVNDWEIELFVARFQFDEEIEDHVDNASCGRAFSRSILLITTIGLSLVLQRFAQDKTRLRLRTVVCIDHKQHAVHHFHDPLDFAAEIRMARRVHDVDPITVPLKGGVLRANGDPFSRSRSIESMTRSSTF